MDIKAKSYLKEFVLKCPICYELYSYTHKPLTIPCGHTMCSECYKVVKKQSEEDDEYYDTEIQEREYDLSLDTDREEEEDNDEESQEDEEDEEESEDDEEDEDNNENEIVTEGNEVEDFVYDNPITPSLENHHVHNANKKIKLKCSICRKKMRINEEDVLINKNVINAIELIDKECNLPTEKQNKKQYVFCSICRIIDTEQVHLSKANNSYHKKNLITLDDETFNRIRNDYNHLNLNSIKSKAVDFINRTLSKCIDSITDDYSYIRQYFLINSKQTFLKKKSFIKLSKLYLQYETNIKEVENITQDTKNQPDDHDKQIEVIEKTEACLTSAEGLCEKYGKLLEVFLSNYDKILTPNEGIKKMTSNLVKEQITQTIKDGFLEQTLNGALPYERRFVATMDSSSHNIYIFDVRINTELLVSYTKIYGDQIENKHDEIEDHVLKNFTMNVEVDENGRFLYLLGKREQDSKQFRCYDLVNRKLHNKASMPYKLSIIDRYFYDGKLYLLGGSNFNEEQFTDCYYYDTAQDNWEYLPSLNIARSNKAITVMNNKIYVFAGNNPNDTENLCKFESLDLNRFGYEDFVWYMFSVKNYKENLQHVLYGFVSQSLLVILGGENTQSYEENLKGFIIDINTREVAEDFKMKNGMMNSFCACLCRGGILIGSEQGNGYFNEIQLRKYYNKVKTTLY